MNEVLKKNVFLVKEHVGMFKAANNFDIFDPQTGEKIMECREERLGLITKLLRFSDYKRMTPFNIQIKTVSGAPVVRVKRGIALFISNVQVFDESDTPIGGFKQKFLSIGGKFSVLDADGKQVCMLKGKWTGWDFSFSTDGLEYAHVSKKWAGIGKELFTSADNYVLEINKAVPENHVARQLILAAVMCIDMVLKE